MQKLNEKQWEEICKDCSHPNLHVALIEYANLDEYLRRIVVMMERKATADNYRFRKEKIKIG